MFSQHDRTVLRDLAKRVAGIAAWPEMAARKALWMRHNRLLPARPMVLILPEGSWAELLPEASLQCEDREARGMEAELRRRIYGAEHFHSDNVVERTWGVQQAVRDTGWGLEVRRHEATMARGSWAFDPVITSAADLKKLTFPEVIVDEAESARRLTVAQETFGDILDVQLTGIKHISFHLMKQYTDWRGLEEAMLDMCEEPAMLHEAMALLEAGHHRRIQQYLDLGLLEINNDGTYHSSGGVGYTDELPAAGFDPTQVRLCDLWASAESQELAQVSPAMHEEFVLQYERRLLAPFGLTGYGCCEDLTHKLEDVLRVPNMRRISISPWADVDRCAETLGHRAIFSWKPNPAYLVGDFSVDQTRAYVGHTVEVARAGGCTLEIILKDTHTCEFHPERFDAWSQVAMALAQGSDETVTSR